MKLLFYRVETKRIKVNELDASLFSDVPKTITLNGVTYELKTPAGMSNPAVYHEVADAASVNECAPSPVIAFDSLPADAKASNPFKGLKYHINDGVGESSSASTSSVKYFRGQIADRDAKIQLLESDVERLRNDKIVANGLIANLEGLAAADGEKIRDLESRLETVAASRERSIDDYNKSVAREGRLREEIQRINLRLADAEHQRDCLLAKVEKYEDGHHPNDGCASEIRRLKSELHEARTASEAVHTHYALVGKQRDEARRERDAAVKRADGLLVNLRSVKQMVAGIE